MPTVLPAELKITRTPLAGGADTVITESLSKADRRVKNASLRVTQSVGNQEAVLVLDNKGNRYPWESGDNVKVEYKRPHDNVYVAFEGILGNPDHSADSPDSPTIGFQVVGWNSVLDLIKITTAQTFATGTAYTTMADSLATTFLSGFTRTITSDVAVSGTPVTFNAGANLRDAFDFLRRALDAATSSRWEILVAKSGGTKEFKLFKRAATVQRTIKQKDLLAGARRMRGDFLEVANRVIVLGATVPSSSVDKTGLALTARNLLDATTKRVAQPFTALDTPLYAVQALADRSFTVDPPTLKAYVMRNSNNLDVVDANRLKGTTKLRTAGFVATPANVDDGNITNTSTMNSTADSTFYEAIVWDLTAAPPGIARTYMKASSGGAATNPQLRLSWSDDDASYTVARTFIVAGEGVLDHFKLAATETHRYWKLEARRTNAGNNLTVFEVALGEFVNAATDPTNPLNVHDFDDATLTSAATTGAATKEMSRLDFRTAKQVAKVTVKHSEGVASGLLTLNVQKSDDGSAWTDLALLPSTTSIVTDTVFVENPAFRYLRFLLKDDRVAASPSQTTNVYFTKAILQTTVFDAPLTSDNMKGSEVTWDVTGLIVRPGTLEERTYPLPRLALVSGGLYWLVFEAGTGASGTSHWSLDYGTEAGATDAVESTDSGATWSAVAADAVLRHKLSFNNRQLTKQVDDATSQTKYSSLVPGGILATTIFDEALVTQDMVDREANALLGVRKNTQERFIVPIPLDPSLVVGQRVTLDPDTKPVFGTSGDFDVVEIAHEFAPLARTVLTLNDHLPSAEDALGVIASTATQRSS